MHRFALVVALACSCLAGCAFKPKVEIRNATNWPLDVEVALPRPANKASAEPTQFRMTIPPGGDWSNVDAPPSDRATLALRKENDVILMRVKAIGSQVPGFVVYELGYALRAVATVREDTGGTFDVVSQLNDEPIWAAKKAGAEYFE